MPAQSSRRARGAPTARFAVRLRVALRFAQQPTGLTLPFGALMVSLPSQISAFCALAARSPCICSRLRVALRYAQQPTGLTLPSGAPSGRFGPSAQVSRLLNHSRFPNGRAHGFAAPLRVALVPSGPSAHRAHASLRATGHTLPSGAPSGRFAAFGGNSPQGWRFPPVPGGRGVCAPGRKHFLSFWRKRPPQADFFDKLRRGARPRAFCRPCDPGGMRTRSTDSHPEYDKRFHSKFRKNKTFKRKLGVSPILNGIFDNIQNLFSIFSCQTVDIFESGWYTCLNP